MKQTCRNLQEDTPVADEDTGGMKNSTGDMIKANQGGEANNTAQ